MGAKKTVAIIQSNYIPWKGYFDLINLSDELILYDDVQYTRSDWRNRNKIKTSRGVKWLTIPVSKKGFLDKAIREIQVSEPGWARGHWDSIAQSYAAARNFREFRGFFEDLFQSVRSSYLSEINFHFISGICRLLGITTKISWSTDYQLGEGKTERLVDLCRQAGASDYLSGPAARDYLDESLFAQGGISVRYMDYSGYPEYEQVHPPFDHAVSIIDPILNVGRDTRLFLKSRQA